MEELARRYDLIVIDHPHVGQITAEGCLTPLDVAGREAERTALAAGSVGRSYPSYTLAAAAMGASDRCGSAGAGLPARPDRGRARDAGTEVLSLAGEGRVLLPLRTPHSLMVFYTLAANLGMPCATGEPGELIDAANRACACFEMMRELFALVDPACLDHGSDRRVRGAWPRPAAGSPARR